MTDTYVSFRPRTDFEKLLFERAANKALLKKLKDRSRDLIQLLTERDQLADQIKALESCPDKDYRRRYELVKRRCDNLEQAVKRLKKTNEDLICKIVSKKI